MLIKKICKYIIATVMLCVLATGINTSFAADKKSDAIEVSTRQELYDALIGLLCKEIPEDEDYEDEDYEDGSYDDGTNEDTASGDKTKMVHILNDEYEDLSNLPGL